MAPEIVVTDEQARLIRESNVPVWVRDVSGRMLGVIAPVHVDDESCVVDEMRRRLQMLHRSYSTEEVLCHLRSLDAR